MAIRLYSPYYYSKQYADDGWVEGLLSLALLAGVVLILRTLLTVIRSLWAYFLRPGVNPKSLGHWAVVTGDHVALKGFDL